MYKDMNKDKGFSLVDIAGEYGISEIDILGGEPLLVPWIKDFITCAMDAGIIINISTNGGLPDSIIHLAETCRGSLNIGFSMLGFSETHNTLTGSDNFVRAITGIKKLVSAGKNPIVKSVLMNGNKGELLDLAAYFAGIGVKRYCLLHEDTIGRRGYHAFSYPEYLDFYSHLKRQMGSSLDISPVAASGYYKHGIHSNFRCDAGVTKIAVMPDGSAFPCNLFAGSGEFFLGNIFTDGLEKIWHNPTLNYFRNYGRGNLCSDTRCSSFSTCTGGCPAHSYYAYGTMDKVDPRCKSK
jgi:radical SAM protein with 4Fe4S-binding SPASM domain